MATTLVTGTREPNRALDAGREEKRRNLALLREDIAAGRSRFRGLPPVVSLLTSDICNLRCVMCDRSAFSGVSKLPRAALQRLIDELFPTAYKVMALGFRGEPTLADFDVVVEGALRHGCKIDLVTNGTMLTVERYRRMREALYRVNVSVDSHVPEVYERIRVGGSFERLRKNLDAIADERQRHPDGVVFDVSAVVMRSNADALPGFVAFAAGLRVDHVHFQLLRHFGTALPQEELASDPARRLAEDAAGGRPRFAETDPDAANSFWNLHRGVIEAARRLNVNVDFDDFCVEGLTMREVPTKLDGLGGSDGLCWNVGFDFAVFPNGDVYPCCSPTDHWFGNVLESPAREVWNSDAALALRESHFARRRTRFCSGCTQAPYLPSPTGSRWERWIAKTRLWTSGVRSTRDRIFRRGRVQRKAADVGCCESSRAAPGRLESWSV